jgi:hypothetical protein
VGAEREKRMLIIVRTTRISGIVKPARCGGRGRPTDERGGMRRVTSGLPIS